MTRDAAKRWVTIGTITDIPDPAKARTRAREILIAARDGVSTLTTLLEPARVAEISQIVERPRSSTGASTHRANTFDSLLPDYLDYCLKKRRPNTPATVLTKKWKLNKHVSPVFGTRDVRTITRAEVDDLLENLSHSPGAQYQAYATLHDFLGWALKKRYVTSHVMSGMGAPNDYTPRQRTLTDDEIRWFWRACDDLGWPYGMWAKLLLLTAQRSSETSKMSRALVDEYYVWSIPREYTKSKRAHIVAFSDLAIDVIKQIPNTGLRFFPDHCNAVWVKKKLNKLMVEHKRQELTARGHADLETVFIEPWVFHDLRRTAATIMARLRQPKHVVHKILNHSEGSRRGAGMLDAVYIIHEYLDERQEALQALADYIKRVIAEGPPIGKGTLPRLRKPSHRTFVAPECVSEAP